MHTMAFAMLWRIGWQMQGSLLQPQTSKMQKFKIYVTPNQIRSLRDRLMDARLPDDLEHVVSDRKGYTKDVGGNEWEYGIPLRIVKEWIDYTLQEWNVNTEIDRLNLLPQYKVYLEKMEFSMHCIHYPCKNTDEQTPVLLLLHGWPGSVLEFSDLIEPLSESFHVICPSLPGYGFSEIPKYTGWGTLRMGQALHELVMRLYPRRSYMIQGGDWGAFIARGMALQFPDYVMGIHLNMISAPPVKDAPLTQFEVDFLAATKEFNKEEIAYQYIQRTKPQSLGYSMTDSPVGLMAWILEKFHTWTGKGLPTPPSYDTKLANKILSNIFLCYWFPGTITSSFRLYREARRDMSKIFYAKIEVPTAMSVFEKEIGLAPKSWVEAVFQLKQWRQHPGAGHFAAIECPDELMKDMIDFRDLLLDGASVKPKL
jgi:pimeloyl-ACP methyl ester carboxylesterase